MTPTKTVKVKAWGIVDVENIGINSPEMRLFSDIEGKFHILETRKEARRYVAKQFFPAKEMGWRVVPVTITCQVPKKK